MSNNDRISFLGELTVIFMPCSQILEFLLQILDFFFYRFSNFCTDFWTFLKLTFRNDTSNQAD